MSSVKYPSLSESGWISSPEQIADNIFADFYASDYSQTYIYQGMVSSFAYIIQSTQGDVEACISKLKNTLQNYFERHFKEVSIEIDDVTSKYSTTNSSAVSLSFYLTFTDDTGTTYNLARVIRDTGTKAQQVIRLNNGI